MQKSKEIVATQSPCFFIYFDITIKKLNSAQPQLS